MIQLDAFRFLAVSSVMFGHWMTYPFLITTNSFFSSNGVNLFFVLSGFLITQILINSKLNIRNTNGSILKQFYIRRSLRIFPLYYLVISLGVIFSIPSIHEHLLWFLTYTTNIICAINSGYCYYFTHLWSLGVEEQFYVAFPLVVLLTKAKNYLKTFYIIIFLAVLSRGVVYFFLKNQPNLEWATYTLTPCCFDSFGIGAILAYLKVFAPEKLLEILKRKYLFFLCLVVCVILYALNNAQTYRLLFNLFYRFTFSLFCFWIIGVASFGNFKGAMKYLLENKVFIYLGKISYGIYVYHHFMPFVFAQFGFDSGAQSKTINTALYFVATILISSLSWYAFEKPLNDLKKYFTYQRLPKTEKVAAV